jgi:3-keto-5-aminohexanoate cleavage enzyme
MSGIDWSRVENAATRNGNRMVWKPYGIPDVVDPFQSAFAPGLEVLPAWDIPETIVVSAALTGAFFSRKANPNQPITTDELLAEARASLEAGATTVHVHVRDDHGYNVLDPDRFSTVIDPLREEHPELVADGCLVCALEGEWERMREVLGRGTLDVVPVNTTAVYCGDSLFAKPAHMMIEKARLVQEAGAKVQIAVYADADVDNAARYLIRPGVLEKPYYWIVLPALPGCSPMHNPRQMVEGLTRIVHSIYDLDPDSVILVCAAGRASIYLTALAAMMGLHVRVGMEDTVWMWPHRSELIQSNAEQVRAAVSLATLLGRRVATSEEYRELIGLPSRAPAAAGASPATP